MLLLPPHLLTCVQCMHENFETPTACQALAEDYLECLHHRKHVSATSHLMLCLLHTFLLAGCAPSSSSPSLRAAAALSALLLHMPASCTWAADV